MNMHGYIATSIITIRKHSLPKHHRITWIPDHFQPRRPDGTDDIRRFHSGAKETGMFIFEEECDSGCPGNRRGFGQNFDDGDAAISGQLTLTPNAKTRMYGVLKRIASSIQRSRSGH